MRIESRVFWSAIVMLLVACGGDDVAPGKEGPDPAAETPEPEQQPDAGGDPSAPTASRLAGVWSVTREATGTFGAPGPMTIEFPSEGSGIARFLGKDARNGVTQCGNYVFATVGDIVILESSTFTRGAFVVAQPDDDTITLTSDSEALTLSRVSGAPPVEECGAVETSTVEWDDTTTYGSLPTFSAFEDVLYLNTNAAGNPIVGYSLSAKTFGPPRTYTVVSNGGVDRAIVAAESHDVFYGHCWCGGSNRLSRFNATTNERLSGVDTTALGHPIQIRYGVHHGGNLIIGGREDGGPANNRLLTLDPVTLALRSTRSILNGAHVEGIAYHEGKLHALVWRYIVEVGADGRATKTYPIPELLQADQGAHGLVSAGGKLYVIGRRYPAGSTLFEITLK